MGWVRKVTEVFRFVFFAFIATVGISNIALAQANLIDEINALIEIEKYDEAYEIVSDTSLDEDTAAHMIRGTLLGFGLLSSGQDICKAVLNFEKVPLSHISLRWALDYLYGGEWARIAANEGNPQALYIVGERLKKTQALLIFLYDKQLATKNAYSYFYNASLLGHLGAKERLTEIEAANPKIDFSKLQTQMQFKDSLCPIREIAR
jgi:hypothetical protein